MKKIIALAGFGVIAFLAINGCGSNPRKETNNPAQDSMPVGQTATPNRPDNNVDNPRALTNDPAYTEGAVLVANNACKTCHAIDTKIVGPSYNMIADKYSNTEGMRDELAYKIVKGGSGRWGNVLMPPQKATIAEANQMAGYILSLKSK